jgi:hypothetical protein
VGVYYLCDMKRNDTRPLSVNNNIWEYKIGRNTVAIYATDGKRYFPKFEDIVGIDAVKNKDFQLNPAVISNYIYKNIISRIFKHVCYYCNRSRNDVKLKTDPFDAEIYDRESKHYMCDSCYSDRRDEI